jgi:hypothetical protein
MARTRAGVSLGPFGDERLAVVAERKSLGAATNIDVAKNCLNGRVPLAPGSPTQTSRMGHGVPDQLARAGGFDLDQPPRIELLHQTGPRFLLANLDMEDTARG